MIANGDATYVQVISAVDGGIVTIENGTFTSEGCTAIYATRKATVVIKGGHFEATDEQYKGAFLLDINEALPENERGTITVSGGQFVSFNPANCAYDGSNTNKVVNGYHSIKGENNVYTVSAHEYGKAWTTDGENHWHECKCGDKADVAEHAYDNACDANCNVCQATREVPNHVYDNACDANCNICGKERTPSDHVYDNACDTTCNVCQATREVPDHVYDNACDANCNVCGNTRTPADHVYDNACDANCNVCGNTRTPADHVYNNACDTTCNECQAVRQVPDHVYDNACDTNCNVCQAVREVPAHVYDNACDTTCNECQAEREITHSYNETKSHDTTEHWIECSVCGNQKDIAPHTYGVWAQVENEDKHSRSCACDYEETEDCSGGKATCTAKATCETCGEEYGTTAEHTLNSNGVCTSGCGYKKVEGGWFLVTDASKLTVGTKIIIVSYEALDGSYYALSNTQNSNNRNGVVIDINNIVTDNNGVQIITLENGSVNNTFAFYVEGAKTGYLFAPGSNNYLRTQEGKDANASWSISIDENGKATIKSNTTGSRNLLKMNPNTGNDYRLFSCYSGNQKDVSIYMYVEGGEYDPHDHRGGTATCQTQATCEYCGELYGSINKEIHADISSSYTDPTCTADGYTTFTCVCGHSYVETNEGTAGHATSPVEEVAADCEIDGHKAYHDCVNCDKYFLDEAGTQEIENLEKWLADASENGGKLEATGHAWGDWTQTNGEHSRVCANDETHVESGKCTGGTATCQTPATCEVCNKEYGDFGNHVDVNPKDYHCDTCNKLMCDKHVGGTATCTDQAICDNCGNKYGDVDATNHAKKITYTPAENKTHTAKYPCCGVTTTEDCVDSNDDDHMCEKCEADDISDHTWVKDTENSVDATCTTGGRLVETCICGETKSTDLVEKGHNCNSDDLCANCGMIIKSGTATLKYSGSTTINMASGTNYANVLGLDETLFTVKGTKNNAGQNVALNKAGELRLYYGSESNGNSLEITCTAEIKSITIKLSGSGAVYTIYVNDQPVNGTNDVFEINSKSLIIKNTKSSNTQLVITSITITYESITCNHKWNEGVETTAATCSKAGTVTYTCSVCKETKTEEIAKLDHTEETVQGKAPSCTEPGLTDGVKCSVCQTVITAQTTIPTTEHQYDENGNCSCGASQSTPKYTVTFKSDNQTVKTVEVEKGQTVDEITPPEKSDYTFKHWTLNGQEYNFSSPVTESIELVAVFEKVVLQPTTITVTMSSNGWSNSTKYTSLNMDTNISVSVNGGSNSGKYYTSDQTWRLYSSENATLTIKAANGKTITKVIIVYNNGSATLQYNGTNISSTEFEVSGNSVVIKATSGKPFIKSITVVYQ